ncbi:hypothetical protein B5181_31085, partial [Streptomyces sp. 4F]
MGFLDRLRGRDGGTGKGDGGAGSAGGNAAGAGASAGVDVPGGTGPSGAVAAAAWTPLPPIQRATGAGRTGVADSGFGGRLPTWQNPSFSAAPSPAVLDPAAGHGLLSGAFTEPARPATGPERPSRGLPSASPGGEPAVRRMPVAPLRAIPP